MPTVSEPGAGSGQPGSPDEARLAEVLQAYLAALQETGKPPDRQSFLARYPDCALALSSMLDGLDCLGAATSQLRELAQEKAPNVPSELFGAESGLPLGDYRILREVGRGGMGVVYEAEQLSLGRRVALKVLPFAAALDPKHLRRFQAEAQAAAQLHHPHIVAVYAVGCERGVHYYAMQFIEGQSLAAVIRELRRLSGEPVEQASESSDASLMAAGLATGHLVNGPPGPSHRPTSGPRSRPTAGSSTSPAAALSTEQSAGRPAYFRTVAHLGIQAAEALAYAHEQELVHRDVKPANLLVDLKGKLWVTDFGLARLPNAAGLTLTGDVMGTVRYMSPEQALGRRDLLDHRTDIYSLGATLYELLTLRPAFPQNDRQELIRRIAEEEPPPPRRLNGAVPVDLETVVLKALAKDPAERYQTAQELADDLKRFLEERPVRARRPSLLNAVRKWARRHRRLVAVASTTLIVGVIAGLAASTGWVWRAYQREAAQRLQAEEQERQAQADRDLAQEAASQLVELANVWLPQEPRVEEEHRKRLRRALELLEKVAERSAADPDGRHAAAGGLRRLAGLHRRVGDHATAGRCLARAIALLEALVTEHPRGRDYRLELSRCNLQLGVLHQTALQYTKAEAAHREAVRHSGQLVIDFPDHVPGLAAHVENLTALAGMLGTRDLERVDERENLLRQALPVNEKLAERFPDHPLSHLRLIGNLSTLAEITLERGRPADAEVLYRRVADMSRELGRRFPGDPDLRAESAGVYRYLGRLLLDTGRWAEAVPVLREGHQVRQEVAERYPSVVGHRMALAWDAALLGTACHALGKMDDAEAAIRQAVASLQDVRQRVPDDAECASGLGRILADCPVERIRAPVQAVELTAEAARKVPERPAFWINLGIAEYRAGNFREAVQALEEGQKRRTGDEGEVWFFLAMSYGRLGEQEPARDYFARAVREMQARKPHSPELRRYRDEARTVLGVTD